MSRGPRSAAIVGAAGGVGTTRLCVEMASVLAQTGRSIAVLDAALETQGLAGYVPGPLDPDMTAVMRDDAHLEAAFTELPAQTTGTVSVCPAYASFSALAKAKTTDAAGRFEAVLDRAGASYDVVLIDTSPIASNPAVAAVTAADRVTTVTRGTEAGADALQRMAGRLQDVGAGHDVAIVNRASQDHPVSSADVRVPESQIASHTRAPAVLTNERTIEPAVTEAIESVFTLKLEPPVQ